jgi:hypothetical protein
MSTAWTRSKNVSKNTAFLDISILDSYHTPGLCAPSSASGPYAKSFHRSSRALYLDLFEQPATRVFQQPASGFIAVRWFRPSSFANGAMSLHGGKNRAGDLRGSKYCAMLKAALERESRLAYAGAIQSSPAKE